MSTKTNPINFAFDISTLKYNMKKKKKLLEEKETSASMDKEESKQKMSKGLVVTDASADADADPDGDSKPSEGIGLPLQEKNTQKAYAKTIHYQDSSSINTLQIIIKNLEKELYDKKTEIRVLSKNFKEKISLTEVENKKLIDAIEDKYGSLLHDITEASENRLREIEMQYESNAMLIQKDHLRLLNEIRMIRATHISIDKHKEKMTELNESWESKYNALKKEYEAKYKQLLNKINESIDMKLSLCKNNISNINSNSQMMMSAEEMIRTITKVQLEHEIGYSSYAFELLGKYNQAYDQMCNNNKEHLDVLKMFTIKKFNDLMLLSDSHIHDKGDKEGRRHKDKQEEEEIRGEKEAEGNKTLIRTKGNELVNYDTSQMQLSLTQNHDDRDSIIKYNDVSQERSKLIQDNFTSEFESFNFNEDSLPNRNIQVLTPPDMIK